MKENLYIRADYIKVSLESDTEKGKNVTQELTTLKISTKSVINLINKQLNIDLNYLTQNHLYKQK